MAEIEEQKKRIIIEKGVEVDAVEADAVEADVVEVEADVVEADEIRKLRKHILS